MYADVFYLWAVNEPSLSQIESLKKAQELQAKKQAEIRARHPESFAELDTVQQEFSHLSEELSTLTARPVELDASFKNSGYAAPPRTHEHASPTFTASPEQEQEEERWQGNMPLRERRETMQLGNGKKPEVKAGHGGRRNTTMKICQQPVLRQYIFNGTLWRAQDVEEVASFELFIDLLFVGIIAVVGDKAAEVPTGEAFLRFCVSWAHASQARKIFLLLL